MEPKSHFWSSLPGVLTGLAALLTAGSGLYIATRPPQVAAPVASAAPPASVDPVRPAAPAPVALRSAVIDDPDGFVNIRTGPGASTAIAGVIKTGEIFTVTPLDTTWWPVRTSGGITGYVHKSRIALRG
jgi:uncharacterized protein YgiM (DUF1202 family)